MIPHAKHGGRGVFDFAVEASKLFGNGLEYEHIGHTQVVVCGRRLLDVGGKGEPVRGAGDEVPLREGERPAE